MKFEILKSAPAKKFKHIKIPKALIFDEMFATLSIEAKMLYGLLLDRASLSAKNKWVNDKDEIFIIYRIIEVQKEFQCSDKKATKLFKELQERGLIEKRKTGKGCPDLIYVKDIFFTGCKYNERFMSRKKSSSKTVKSSDADPNNLRGIYTNANNTDNSDIYPICESDDEMMLDEYCFFDDKAMYDRQFMRNLFKQRLQYDVIYNNNDYDSDMLANILDIMVDTYCSKSEYIKISGDEKPTEVVRSVLMKLEREHVEYVLDSIEATRKDVKNMRRYLLATIYNAPATFDTFLKMKVNRDMNEKRKKFQVSDFYDEFGAAG